MDYDMDDLLYCILFKEKDARDRLLTPGEVLRGSVSSMCSFTDTYIPCK